MQQYSSETARWGITNIKFSCSYHIITFSETDNYELYCVLGLVFYNFNGLKESTIGDFCIENVSYLKPYMSFFPVMKNKLKISISNPLTNYEGHVTGTDIWQHDRKYIRPVKK